MNVTEIKVPKFKDITNNFSIMFPGHAYCMVSEYGGVAIRCLEFLDFITTGLSCL